MSLIPLDTEGEWNRPLLNNAAAMSKADCIFAGSGFGGPQAPGVRSLDEALSGFQHVIACEAVRDSENVYEFPSPRGKTALIVGNEEKGISRSVLKKADNIVSIPMVGADMSSVNVAVSAAIALYVFSKDLGRKKRGRSNLAQRSVDVLINAPDDPHELGSLLRSMWAFGWRRVFISDSRRVWFTKDHNVILEGRAAARRAKNPLTVLPASQMDPDAYDCVILCDGLREGIPLSRFRMPSCRRLLLIYGSGYETVLRLAVTDRIFVDQTNAGLEPRFRHAGSILLSMVSEMTVKQVK